MQQSSADPQKPKPNKQHINERIFKLLKNPKMNLFTSEYIVQLLNKDSLVKIQEFMRKNKTLKITEFIRFFRELLPFKKQQEGEEEEFYIYYALFKLFQEICNSKKKVQISFSDLSSYIAQKMPNFTQQTIIQQKLLPLGLDIDQSYKASIIPPQVYGQFQQERCYLVERPIKSDRIQHLSRDVGQSEYSKKHKLYFSIDKPSPLISILDDDFNTLHTLKTEQDMTKRDMIINYIAWSERQQKIACILGNYSISMWSKEDGYKYEVNVPLPHQYLGSPFVIIKYMDSLRKWITLDNRPYIHVLDHRNYEPEYSFGNLKIRKKKESQKMIVNELHYVQLLCLGFERNVFLVSLKNKQIVSEVSNFKTAITSITFSESHQALFISTYENYFRSYELSEYQDLMERGKFEGHKTVISLLGVIQQKPIVFSIQQNSMLKMFDMRDYTCYQSFSVLKNIMYKQVLYLDDAICLVGSKMHVYKIQKQMAYKQKQNILYINTLHKDLLVVTNKCIRIYDIHNGSLKSVVKAIFGQSQSNSDSIYSAFCLEKKEKLMIQNQQGECIILETKQMSQRERWKLQAKPSHMFYDEENDLLTQVSLGNIYINLFENEYCQKQLRRSITNSNDAVRLVKINIQHDLILLCYQQDESLHFYSYEKGKMLGYLYYGEKKIVKFKNAYRSPKIIHRVIGVELHESKNLIFILLSDQLLIMTYKKSMSSVSFLIKKSIKLWKNPLKLKDNKEYIYNEEQLQQPLYSTGIAVFDRYIAISSNKVNIICSINYDMAEIGKVDECILNKENYNPIRIGSQEHIKPTTIRKPMVAIKDYVNATFQPLYHVYKHNKNKLENFAMCDRIGNLFVIADENLNVIFMQNPNWEQIAGIINCNLTLPKFWNIFMYSQQEIREMEFVLNFLENEYRIPYAPSVKALVANEQQFQINSNRSIARVTIEQLIKEDKEKNEGAKSFRSSSLREKKMALEKQRDQKEKLQNFLEQQKLQKRLKPNNAVKNNAQKQINDTLAYLSLNHNQTILKKGIIDEDFPVIRALQRKLVAVANKDELASLFSHQEKKSLISKRSHEVSKISKLSTKKIQHLPTSPVKQPAREQRMIRTISTQIYQGMSNRLGTRNYSSKQLIQTLNKYKSQSKLKLRSLSKDSLPKLFKK